MAPKMKDLTGQKFGALTVVEFAGIAISRHSIWLCECSCENNTRVRVYSIHLKSGRTISCGCARAFNNIRHGHTSSIEKHSAVWWFWQNIKTRTRNPNVPRYTPTRGGRPAVCERWLNSFEAFFADVGERPTAIHRLRIIDRNRPYEPGNVEWRAPKPRKGDIF